MSIKKSLGNLVIALGGTPTSKTVKGLVGEVATALGGSSNGKTVAEQIDNITAYKAPLFNLKVDADIAATVDLFGKKITDLQSDVYVAGDMVHGIAKHVTGYTGFSGNVNEQSGYYVALRAYVPNIEDVTITFKGAQEVVLDSDGIIVVKIKPNCRPISFTASKTGYVSATKTFTFKGITFKPEVR